MPFICMIHLLLNVAKVDAFASKIVRHCIQQKEFNILFKLIDDGEAE